MVDKKGTENKRKLMLHQWYVDVCGDLQREEPLLCGRGYVSGHQRLMDSTYIHTSYIKNMEVNDETKEMIIHTCNSIYFCPLEYCDFDKQDKNAGLLPDYERIKEQYYGKRVDPSIEEGKVLLVLSNFDNYYFHSLYYKPEGAAEPLAYEGYSHVGTFQDSFLVPIKGAGMELRYFPHYENIEFYMLHLNNKPFYIENIGDITLYAKNGTDIFCLAPGERKEIIHENAEKEIPLLVRGDLYPAGFIDLDESELNDLDQNKSTEVDLEIFDTLE